MPRRIADEAVDLTWPTLIFLLGLIAFFALFLFYPLWYAIVQSLVVDGRLTVAFYELMVTSPVYQEAILNSFRLGMITTIATTLLSLPLAFLLVRYDFVGKGFVSGLILVPMVLPPFVGAIGMKQMFARFGSINLLLLDLGLIDQPIDWFGGGGFVGVVILEVLHLYPIMYLNVAAALANVDPSLEDAARNMGSSGFRLFRTVTFPLMLPGYFAGAIIVFIWAFTDLGTPLIFNYRQVVAVEIFNSIEDINENPMAYALVVFVLLLTVFFFYLSKATLGNRRYEMIARGYSSSGSRRASRGMTALIYAAMLSLTGLAMIPHASVFLTSVAERWFMTVLPQETTGRFYAMVFEHPMSLSSIEMSLMLSVLSTALDIGLGIGIAYLLTRTRIPYKGVLDAMAMLPLALPGLVLAFGYLAGYSGTFLDARHYPVPLLVIAYAVRRLPYMVRAAYAGFQQTSITLEEAARNLGRVPAPHPVSNYVPADFSQPGGRRHFVFCLCHARSERQFDFGPQRRVLPDYQSDLRADGPHCRRRVFSQRDGRFRHGVVDRGLVLGRAIPGPAHGRIVPRLKSNDG